MNKQRGGLMTKISVIQACAAAVILAACAPKPAEPVVGLVALLYKGMPANFVVTGSYDSACLCDADIHEKAKHVHSVPGMEARYFCVPTALFKHIDMLAGPMPDEPAPADQITRL